MPGPTTPDIPIGPLLALGIEASNPSAGGASVALAEIAGNSARAIDREALDTSDRRRDDLMPAIDRLCARAGVEPGDFGGVAVSVGPGGYTAVRTACAAGIGIAMARSGRACAVPTELALARRVEERVPFAIALASKRGEAWVRVFGREGVAADEGGSVLDADGFAALVDRAGVRTLVIDRFGPDAWRAVCDSAGVSIVEPVFDARAVLECAAGGVWAGPEVLVPVYPREPEAVRVWRERRGR